MSSYADNSKGSFTISVVDPVKQDQSGLNPYITYKINTNTDRPDFNYGQFSVIRRFKDFCWLSERLSEEFPGIINPPLPDKETLKRFDPEHIQKRRAELERYLGRVAAHSELSGSQYFKTFLQADDVAMAEKKEEVKALKGGGAAAAGAGFLRWFDDAVTLVKTQINKDEHVAKSEVDQRFDAIAAYVSELDTQVQVVARHSTSLVRRQEALGTTTYDLGFGFTQLANAERDAASLGAVLHAMGERTDTASVAIKQKAQREAEAFEGPVNEYVKVIAAVKAALAKRHEKKISYMTAASEVETRAAAHSKLQGVPGKEDKLAAAEEALSSAQMHLDSSKAAFEEVTARVLREFERFRREKAADIRQMLLDFVSLQIEYSRKLGECWSALKPSIESMELPEHTAPQQYTSEQHYSSSSSGGHAHAAEHNNSSSSGGNLNIKDDIHLDGGSESDNVHSPTSPRGYGIRGDTIVGV